MSPPLPESDEALEHLAFEQIRTGNIEAAKGTASKITDPKYQRSAWMQILYAQFYELKDLRAVRETVLLLSDSNLWKGSWVHDLVSFTARSGDIEGAKTFVDKLTGQAPRGLFLTLIASAQAQQGDYPGAEATYATIEHGSPWRDLGLVFIIREMAIRGDRAKADTLVNRIADPEIKASALSLCASSSISPTC